MRRVPKEGHWPYQLHPTTSGPIHSSYYLHQNEQKMKKNEAENYNLSSRHNLAFLSCMPIKGLTLQNLFIFFSQDIISKAGQIPKNQSPLLSTQVACQRQDEMGRFGTNLKGNRKNVQEKSRQMVQGPQGGASAVAVEIWLLFGFLFSCRPSVGFQYQIKD